MFYAKSGLNIAITVAMNEGSVAFAVLIGFDSHPGNLCLRLNIPFITRSPLPLNSANLCLYPASSEAVNPLIYRIHFVSHPLSLCYQTSCTAPNCRDTRHYATRHRHTGGIEAGAISVHTRFCTITGSRGNGFAVAVAISRHDPNMPAVAAVLAPLRDIASQLQNIAIALGFQLVLPSRHLLRPPSWRIHIVVCFCSPVTMSV